MQMIVSPIKRAMLTHNLVSADRTLSDLLASVMASVGFGLILVTADRRIIYANNTADALFHARSGLRNERNCISAVDFTSTRKLQSLVTAAWRQTDESLQRASLIIPDEDGAASLMVHVVPLCPNSVEATPNNEYPVAGLVMVDCQRNTVDRVNVFTEYFDLTSAEARVLAQLISGEGLTVAAQHLDIARSTARTHLARILEKTGTHRQAELVRLFFETTIPCEGYASATGKRRIGRP